eukprot:7532874-Pyramimonas_sp.AAC.1
MRIASTSFTQSLRDPAQMATQGINRRRWTCRISGIGTYYPAFTGCALAQKMYHAIGPEQPERVK